jgi:hypothetical protein
MADTTVREHASGWACIDCVMLLANGETDPEWSDIGTQDYLLSVEQNTAGYEVTLGRMLGEDGCEHSEDDGYEDHAETCERQTFSWLSCDVCGSTLGGSRDAVTFWEQAR